MNNIIFILLINIIIILCYKFNISGYVYPFIFIIGCVLYVQLIYVKDKELVEGLNDEDVLSYWNKLDEDIKEDEKIVENKLLNKIDSVVKLLTKLETSNNKYAGQQCEGKFKVKETDRECGFDVYDEYKYIVTKPGDNCEYMPGFIHREYKDKCKLDQKCKDDSDCEIGGCKNNVCKMNFECSTTELDNCDEESCDNLNKLYGANSYEFKNNKCMKSTCNTDSYFNCDTQESCEGLGLNYIWDPEKTPKCGVKEQNVLTCESHECPAGFFHIPKNKNITCRQPYNEGDKTQGLGNIITMGNKKYLDRCTTEVCCQPEWVCSQYYSASSVPPKCSKYETQAKTIQTNDTESIPTDCISNNDTEFIKNGSYSTFDLTSNKPGTIYYAYNGSYSVGDTFNHSDNCNQFDCSPCKSKNICTCSGGTAVTGNECTKNGSNICSKCDSSHYLEGKECKSLTVCGQDQYTSITETGGSDRKCEDKRPCFLVDTCNYVNKVSDTSTAKKTYGKNGSIFTDGKLNSPGIGVSWYYTKSGNMYNNCENGVGGEGNPKRSKPNLSGFDECLPPKGSDNGMNINASSIKNYNDNTSDGLILESWDGSKYNLVSPVECPDGHNSKNNGPCTKNICSGCKNGYGFGHAVPRNYSGSWPPSDGICPTPNGDTCAMCFIGYKLVNGSCVKCGEGSSTGDQETGHNTFETNWGSTNSKCTKCKGGYSMWDKNTQGGENSKFCTKCKAGYSSHDKNTTPTNSNTCQPCNKGFYKTPGGTKCVTCSINSIIGPGSSVCGPDCQWGHSNLKGNLKYAPQPVGRWAVGQDIGGQCRTADVSNDDCSSKYQVVNGVANFCGPRNYSYQDHCDPSGGTCITNCELFKTCPK